MTHRPKGQKGSTVTPTIGRIVHYHLSGGDLDRINRKRALSSAAFSDGLVERGNPTLPGQVVPLVVTAVWPDEYGPGTFGVNGQALLDGSDSLWVTSAAEGSKPGQWSWPPKV